MLWSDDYNWLKIIRLGDGKSDFVNLISFLFVVIVITRDMRVVVYWAGVWVFDWSCAEILTFVRMTRK